MHIHTLNQASMFSPLPHDHSHNFKMNKPLCTFATLMLIKRIWPYYEIYPKLLLSCRNCLKIYSEFGYPFEKHDSHSSVILKNSQTETKCRCLSAAQLYLKENIYNCKVWHWNHPHKCKYLYSILICLLISLQHLSYTQTRNDMNKLLKIVCVCT